MHRLIRAVVTIAAATGFFAACPPCADATAPAPWLLVSDIHLDPAATTGPPSAYGSDTNLALLQSSIAEMKRVDPAPPVVFITGDFLAHHFDSRRAVTTMTLLAKRFDQAFPKAQFVITLGNEDSACGDYSIPLAAPFLHSVAVAWAPLVDRNGAAPSFVRTFSRDGFYTARLPGTRLRAVVIDDVAWSPRYRPCGGMGEGAATFDDLRRGLTDRSDRSTWVVVHIPPGIDAFSTTHIVHRLAVVPFLDPEPRRELLSLVQRPSSHVVLVLAAHTHKFAYRIAGGRDSSSVPMFLVPSVSPIFRNAPSFVTANVKNDGTIERADVHALLAGRWQTIGGTASLGLAAFTSVALLDLQSRLARDRTLRERWARLYNAGAPAEINEQNWRSYWCAATEFDARDFRSCTGSGGISILTGRGVRFVAVGAALAGAAIVCFGVLVWRGRHRHRRNERSS